MAGEKKIKIIQVDQDSEKPRKIENITLKPFKTVELWREMKSEDISKIINDKK